MSPLQLSHLHSNHSIKKPHVLLLSKKQCFNVAGTAEWGDFSWRRNLCSGFTAWWEHVPPRWEPDTTASEVNSGGSWKRLRKSYCLSTACLGWEHERGWQNDLFATHRKLAGIWLCGRGWQFPLTPARVDLFLLLAAENFIHFVLFLTSKQRPPRVPAQTPGNLSELAQIYTKKEKLFCRGNFT